MNEEKSEMIRMCVVSVDEIERFVDLLRMAMEVDDLAGTLVYCEKIQGHIKTIRSYSKTVYATQMED